MLSGLLKFSLNHKLPSSKEVIADFKLICKISQRKTIREIVVHNLEESFTVFNLLHVKLKLNCSHCDNYLAIISVVRWRIIALFQIPEKSLHQAYYFFLFYRFGSYLFIFTYDITSNFWSQKLLICIYSVFNKQST